MFNLYRLISFITLPIILINIFWRILKNKEDGKRYKERFGISSVKRPKNNIIWMHAASVGEFKSCNIIIQTYYKKNSILVTTTTKSAADYAARHYSNKIIHQYAPFDFHLWVERFVKYWKPQMVLWIESDLWPNTMYIIKKNNIESLFINARISPKSFIRWKKFPQYYNNLLKTFSSVYAQSKEDQKRLQFFSTNKIKHIGNLKLAKISKNKKIFPSKLYL